MWRHAAAVGAAFRRVDAQHDGVDGSEDIPRKSSKACRCLSSSWTGRPLIYGTLDMPHSVSPMHQRTYPILIVERYEHDIARVPNV